MRTAATRLGRLFLLHGRALYVGPSFGASMHAHHALQASFVLKGTMRVRTKGGRFKDSEGVVIPPDSSFSSHSFVSHCLVPRMSRERTA